MNSILTQYFTIYSPLIVYLIHNDVIILPILSLIVFIILPVHSIFIEELQSKYSVLLIIFLTNSFNLYFQYY